MVLSQKLWRRLFRLDGFWTASNNSFCLYLCKSSCENLQLASVISRARLVAGGSNFSVLFSEELLSGNEDAIWTSCLKNWGDFDTSLMSFHEQRIVFGRAFVYLAVIWGENFTENILVKHNLFCFSWSMVAVLLQLMAESIHRMENGWLDQVRNPGTTKMSKDITFLWEYHWSPHESCH